MNEQIDEQVVDKIERRVAEVLSSLEANEIKKAQAQINGCREEVARLRNCLDEVQKTLHNVPAIEIAFLGPSRHGKSTLLNALAQQSILPTSDVMPCTAAIVRIKWSPTWSVRVRFVGKEELIADWKAAVKDARDYLDRLNARSDKDELPDESRYLHNTLQRFIQLFRLNPEDDPEQLVEQVRGANIPSETGKLLGKVTQPKSNSLETMKGVVKKYLSTTDVYWTIVDSCEIAGPFDDWHHNLNLVDLPGTNDTNTQRAAITNSLREKSQAVAIVTSDSNLGSDIESWLKNSTVLSEFLEAKDSSRQRLFILRTKLDSYYPEVLDQTHNTANEQEEERLRRAAIQRYKDDQTIAYHAMFREIVMPMLPSAGGDKALILKRKELLDRIRDIRVFFVSGLAHEVFVGRLSVGKKQRQRLEDHFNNDLSETGIPELRKFVNRLAEEYLVTNFYEDLENRLEREVGLLARYFRKESSTIQAQLAGAGESVRSLITHVEHDVLPWIGTETKRRIDDFRQNATQGGSAIRHRLDQVWAISERRFQDKLDKWTSYAWNSLKATARKGGSHTTGRGIHIDINQDICSVLVDDLILVWTSYRDYLIEVRITETTDDFAEQLRQKLQQAATQTDNRDAQFAIAEIIEQLQSITNAQRHELLREVNAKIKQLESIRKPAYEYIRQAMQPTFQAIQNECGSGCQSRIHQHIINGFHANIGRIRDYINRLVNDSIDDLMNSCTSAMQVFGETSRLRISSSINTVAETQRMNDLQLLEERGQLVTNAMAVLN